MDIEKVKEISVQEANIDKYDTTHNESKLDELLFMNGLVRKRVPVNGNCFFQSALPHINTQLTVQELRKSLCDHMVEKAKNYIVFFAAKDMSESFEEDITWIDFRQEIEVLSGDGIWTNRAADLLPLALANWTSRLVKIFSGLPHQPIIEVQPTLEHTQCSDPIFLAYLASDSSTNQEHYDMCFKMDSINEESTSNSQNMPDNVTHENNVDQKTPSTSIREKKKRGRPKGTTLLKAPNFITPSKKSLCRKRKATPESWKKNVRKKLRLAGKEYISAKGNVVQERSLKHIDCSECTFKCTLNINDKSRNDIFQTFWSLDKNARKKDFVVANTTEKKTRTYLDEDNTPVRKKKNVHRTYSFCVEGVRLQVCKKYFLATLGVSESFVQDALNNQQAGVYVGTDKRGKHEPPNKTSQNAMETVRKHIESFPAVGGHYTRKESNRKYLDADLSITRMHKLYLEQCKGVIPEKEIVSQSVYRKVFNDQYNFSFHVPKKDLCGVCNSFNHATGEGCLTPGLKERYEKHKEIEVKARAEMKKDQELAKKSSEIFVATFDLQAVLTTPCSLASQLYYLRKLSCYNLPIYNLANNNATCYVWSEVEAQRGSCEIGTCLYLQLLSLPSSINHAIFYSGACSGQNRNQVTATCLLYAVIHHSSINIIDHKFLESGHAQMECDSMHSAVEFAKKKTEIFVPQQWETVLRMARRKDPYNIVPLKFGDIYDFKQYTKKYMEFQKEDVNGQKVNWLHIKWIRYTKENPDYIMFKYNFEGVFRVLKVAGTAGRDRNSDAQELTRKYTSRQSISAAKKKDLVSLCLSGVILSEYHEFYKTLPSSTNVDDTLADTDNEEEQADTDIEEEQADTDIKEEHADTDITEKQADTDIEENKQTLIKTETI